MPLSTTTAGVALEMDPKTGLLSGLGGAGNTVRGGEATEPWRECE